MKLERSELRKQIVSLMARNDYSITDSLLGVQKLLETTRTSQDVLKEMIAKGETISSVVEKAWKDDPKGMAQFVKRLREGAE